MLGVKIPADDGGEGKKDQADHEDEGRQVFIPGKRLPPGIVRDLHTLQRRVPGTRYHQAQARHGADDNGIDEGTRHGHKALPHRVLFVGSRRSDGRRTEARLVGKHAAPDAHAEHLPDGDAGTRSKGRTGRKSTFDDKYDSRGDSVSAADQHHGGAEQIGHGHEGYQGLADLGNAFHAA